MGDNGTKPKCPTSIGAPLTSSCTDRCPHVYPSLQALDEIHAGSCDGLTYEQVRAWGGEAYGHRAGSAMVPTTFLPHQQDPMVYRTFLTSTAMPIHSLQRTTLML